MQKFPVIRGPDARFRRNSRRVYRNIFSRIEIEIKSDDTIVKTWVWNEQAPGFRAWFRNMLAYDDLTVIGKKLYRTDP